MKRNPPKIQAALDHVRSFFPDVVMVVFSTDARWQYMTEEFEAPVFPNEVDVTILEEAVYDLDELPALYYYNP